MLITLSGIDCTGKSTQLTRLRETLEQRGLRIGVMWLRPGYSPQMDAARRLVRRLSRSALPTVAEPSRREKTFARPGVSQTWVAMAVTDMLLQYGARLRIELARNDLVICDRYLHDARIDLLLRFPAHARAVEQALSGVARLVPTPTLQFLLSISHDEMLRRMEQKQEPFPDPAPLRERRYADYVKLGQHDDVVMIAADRSIEAVHAEIMARIEPLLARRS